MALLASICLIPMIPNFHPSICLLEGKQIPSYPPGDGMQPRLNQPQLSMSLAKVDYLCSAE